MPRQGRPGSVRNPTTIWVDQETKQELFEARALGRFMNYDQVIKEIVVTLKDLFIIKKHFEKTLGGTWDYNQIVKKMEESAGQIKVNLIKVDGEPAVGHTIIFGLISPLAPNDTAWHIYDRGIMREPNEKEIFIIEHGVPTGPLGS